MLPEQPRDAGSTTNPLNMNQCASVPVVEAAARPARPEGEKKKNAYSYIKVKAKPQITNHPVTRSARATPP